MRDTGKVASLLNAEHFALSLSSSWQLLICNDVLKLLWNKKKELKKKDLSESVLLQICPLLCWRELLSSCFLYHYNYNKAKLSLAQVEELSASFNSLLFKRDASVIIKAALFLLAVSPKQLSA